MKTTTFAAAGLSLAYVAAAVPLCAINCFQDVVTEHPPLDCTEPDMYHCFCKMTDLQQYFVECAYSDCPSTAEGEEAVGFGVDLCEGLGLPITIDTKPPTEPTTPPPEEPSSTSAPPDTTDDDSGPEPTTSDAEPTESEAEPTESESGPAESEATAKPTETDDKTGDDDTPTETGSTDEPSASGSDDGEDGASGSGDEDDGGAGGDEEVPVTAGAGNPKIVSGLAAVAGLAAVVLV